MSRRGLWLLFTTLLFSTSLLAQTGVRIVVVNEFANVRKIPAIGAEVIASVPAGTEFPIVTGRSGDGEWVRVDYFGNEGWVNLTPTVVLSGDVNALPVADPRTIPYGGFEAPRSGLTSATGGVLEAQTNAGLRLRAGPSTAYPTLASIPFNANIPITGKTRAGLWYQTIWEGTLGWVFSGFLRIPNSPVLNNVPIDGIVADEAPRSGTTGDDYIGTLKLLRDRLDLAQPSLDHIRASWTDSAITGRASCQPYPPRPSNINIPVPLLAAFFPTLDPLQREFNSAMEDVRNAIDLFIQICNLPGTGNPVGSATVQGALGIVNSAETKFASLRAKLNELIPPDRVAGADECTLIFNGQVEILPLLQFGVIYGDQMTPRDFTKGYCIDIADGQTVRIETLQIPPSNLVHFLSLSPLDNPTNFVALGRGNAGLPSLLVSPIIVQTPGRYLIIITDIGSDTRSVPPQGDFAILVSDISTATNLPTLQLDPATGSITIVNAFAPPVTDGTTTGGAGGGETTTGGGGTTVCPSLAFTCSQLFTCEEAQACFNAGNFSLDPDEDGVPCEESLCTGG